MLRILSVDDSSMVHAVVKKALSDYDVELITAKNGAEGLMRAATDKPDLILLDINMPVMDGHATLQRMKKDPDLAEIPIIMLTAETSPDSQEKAFENGVWMYLTKPFTPDVLIGSLQGFIPLEPKTPA